MPKKLRLLQWIVALSLLTPGVGLAQGPPNKLEPPGPPGPTMKTLDEIPPTWSQTLPAAQRFQLVLGGDAILDKETGLVWEQSPSTSTFSWEQGQFKCNVRTTGNRFGWRLPTFQELASLLDLSVATFLKLPSGHPFSTVEAIWWSATTDVNDASQAWYMIPNGQVGHTLKSGVGWGAFWCVRGGRGVDPQ